MKAGETYWTCRSSDAPDAVELCIFDYDAHVVKQWIRGVMDVRKPSGDADYDRFMDEMDVFLSKWLTGPDEDVAMGIAQGRQILIQQGEMPAQLSASNPLRRRFR